MHLFQTERRVLCIRIWDYVKGRDCAILKLISRHFRETMPEEPKTTWSKWQTAELIYERNFPTPLT
jgi:hypothetical protein